MYDRLRSPYGLAEINTWTIRSGEITAARWPNHTPLNDDELKVFSEYHKKNRVLLEEGDQERIDVFFSYVDKTYLYKRNM